MDAIKPTDPMHDTVQGLLPWYVKDALDQGEMQIVDAHLAGCDACRAELESERALCASLAAMPLDVELGLAAMRQRIAARPPVQHRLPWLGIGRAPLLLAAQLLLLVTAIVAFSPLARPASYHALGAAPAPAAANVLVMFSADARIDAIDRALIANGLRVVDGPTETGAFMLHATPERRSAALASLKARSDVTLAEPIGP